MIVLDQKFLIEKVTDEDVMELTIHVRDFGCALLEKISTWTAWTSSGLPPPSWSGLSTRRRCRCQPDKAEGIGHFPREDSLWVLSPATGVLPIYSGPGAAGPDAFRVCAKAES